MKFINIFIASLILAFSQVAFSHTLHLSANGSKVITNHFAKTFTATCQIQSTQAKNKIQVSILKSEGRVNGTKLTEGQARSFTVNNNQTLSVSAEPGTKINFLNLTSQPIAAICST